MNKKLIFWLICIFMVGLNVQIVSSLDVGLDSSEVGVVLEIPETPINYSVINTNSSDKWDDLDSPSDIGLISGFLSWVGDALSFSSTILNNTITSLFDEDILANRTDGNVGFAKNVSAVCYQVGNADVYICQDRAGELSLHVSDSDEGIVFVSAGYNLLNISALGSAGAQPTKLLLEIANAGTFIEQGGVRIIDFLGSIIDFPNSVVRITGFRHQVLMDADFAARTGMYEVGAGSDSQWGFNGTDSIHRASRIVGVGNHWFGLIGEDDIYFNNSRAFGNSVVDGNITANYFVGDGSELTDIDIGSSHNTSRLTDYAVGNWWFEKDSIDSSGNDNGGTVNGNPVNTTGIVGNAYEFDGDGDYISFGDPSWTNSEGTISAWIKPISTGVGQIVAITKGSDATNGIQFYTGSNNLYFYLKTSSALINFNNPLTMDSAWHHVAVTQDGTTSKMYIDGAVQSNTDSGEWLDDLAGLAYYRIGNVQWSGSDTNHFNGTIDEVLIFNRSLGANEIKAIYDSQKRGTPHQTIATENIIPLKNNTYSLGSSALRWLNGWFSGDLEVGGNITADTYFGKLGSLDYPTIYCEASDLTDQPFAVAGFPYRINITTTDEGNGIIMNTAGNGTNITVLTDGVYHMVLQPQVKAGAVAGGKGDFHMWLEKSVAGAEFSDVPHSNIELSLGTNEEDVIILATTLKLGVGDVMRAVASVSDNNILLHTQSPIGEPIIPSIIFTMYRVGG